jgi:hypothetical protein
MVIVVGTPLLFVGGPGYCAPRWWQKAWNLGHVVYFMAAARLLAGYTRLGAAPFTHQLLVLIGFSLAGGGAIELLQRLVGRTMSGFDVVLDVAGGAGACLFFFAKRKTVPAVWVRVGQAGVAGVVMVAVIPVVTAGIDECRAAIAFPVLANMEHPSAPARWAGRNVALRRSREHATEGAYSLSMTFLPGSVSVVSLRDFPADWRGYEKLVMDVYNPHADTVALEIRIYNGRGRRGAAKRAGGFASRHRVAPGTNTIRIGLRRAHDAHAISRLDMTDVRGFNLRVGHVRAPCRLYLDRVRLVKALAE